MDLTNTRFYLGTTRGVLLSITGKPHKVKVFKNNETTEITEISEGRHPEELLLGYGNGNVDIFDTGLGSFRRKVDNLEGGEGVTGICCIRRSVVLSKLDGVINIWRDKWRDFFSLNIDENATLETMAPDRNRENVIGTGGFANDYKLWNIETKQCIFKAKSLGHDHLQLPIPTSIRGICFFNTSRNLGACCTKEGRVLLYDDRVQRKPISNYFHHKASYTTIISAARDLQVFVGTTKGYMQWLDLRCASKSVRTYSNFAGAVTGIACDPLKPYVASVSLDRQLRIHKIDSKELMEKVYMKQNLSCILMRPVIKDEQDEDEETEEVDEEYEDLFRNMEQA